MKNILPRRLFGRYCTFALLLVFLFGFSLNTYAQEEKPIYHPLSDNVLLSLEYSTTIGWTDYNSSVFSFAWRGYGEYFLPTYSNLFFGIRTWRMSPGVST